MFDQKRQLSFPGEPSDIEDELFVAAKKTKIDEVPSKVLHIRSLAVDVSEKEVALLGVPFGIIRNLLVTKNGQAFMEFQAQACATKMLEYFTKYSPPVIRGSQAIRLQYSKHTELTTTAKASCIETVLAANKMHTTLTTADSNRNVLRVHIEQATSTPLGYMPFYQALSRFGQILRIVTFKSSAVPQAFLEFLEPVSVDLAKLLFDGCPFVAGGICRTNYSRQPTLEVHQENQFCRDFIKNPITNEDTNSGVSTLFDSKVISGLPSIAELATLDAGTLCAFANEVIQAMVFVAANIRGSEAQTMHSQIATIRQLIPMVQSTFPVTNVSAQSLNRLQTAVSWVPDSVTTSCGPSPVLLVSQLNAQRTSPDTLFTLFGVYGDVQRVKILFSKRDTALVQLSDGNQAQIAMQYLNNVPLFGNTIRVTHSKYNTISMSTNTNESGNSSAGEAADLNRDYTGSRHHRYRNANSRNFLNICPPNSVLHVSNLSEGATDAEIRTAFTEVSGHPVISIKILPNDKKMALVEFENLGNAIEALVALDTHEIKPGSRMRVTFSKFPLRNEL